MLEVSDLRGETLLIFRRGLSGAVDAARDEFEKYSYPT